MSRVIRTSPALQDVLSIVTYIGERNVSAADHWLSQLDRILELLAKNPELGERIDALGHNVRRQVLGSFLVFYRPSIDGIELLRVLHGSRRIEDLFD